MIIKAFCLTVVFGVALALTAHQASFLAAGNWPASIIAGAVFGILVGGGWWYRKHKERKREAVRQQ